MSTLDSNSNAPLTRSNSQSIDAHDIGFDDLYRLEGLLGRGAYSEVREGFHKYMSTPSVAVKCIDRRKLSDIDEVSIRDEVHILRNLRHNSIIHLYDVFQEQNRYCFVMERLCGGELFDRIINNNNYSEADSRKTCQNILEAVQFCHQHKIAHRDLKPENLLLVSETDNTTIKIADFGYAKVVPEPNSLMTLCGTRSYIAPEIISNTPYDERVDMWSIGVILYIMLSGLQPFCDNGDDGIFHKICNGEYYFDDACWANVTMGAKELICGLMQVDPSSRLTATQALMHPWFFAHDNSYGYEKFAHNMQSFQKLNLERNNTNAVLQYNGVSSAAA